MSQVFNMGQSGDQLIGQAAGQGINQALQTLAQHQLQKVQQRQQQNQFASGLQALPGMQLSPEQAQQIAQLPPQVLQEYVKSAFKQQQVSSPNAPINLERQQKAIQARNKPFLNKLSTGVELASNMKNIASEMQSLLDTGKVASGLGGHVPGVLQNEESQRFEALSNELAGLIASKSGSGVATNFKIKLAQSMKPNLRQKTGTQRALIQDLLKSSDKILSRQQAVDAILEQNEGNEPANLEYLVNQYLKNSENSPQMKQQQEQKLPLQQAPQEEENLLSTLGRGALRTGARVGEVAIGLPGDILGGALGLGNMVSGGAIPSYQQVQEKLPISLPTSDQVKKFHEKHLTGESLKPQGKTEEFVDDVVSDMTTLLSPAKGKIPFAKALGKAFVKSGLGNAAGWAAQSATGSELAGAGAKMGTLMIAGLKGGKAKLKDFAKEEYKTAKAAAGEASHDARVLQHKLNDIEKQIGKRAIPGADIIRDHIKSIGNKIRGKSIKVIDSWDLRTDVNDALSDFKTPKASQSYLKQLNGILNENIKEYSKLNPKFGNAIEGADEVWKALHARTAIENFIDKYPKAAKIAGIAGGGGASILSWFFPKASIIGAGATGAAIYAEKGYKLLSQSPLARKHYKDLVNAALSKNKILFARSLKGLAKDEEEFKA